MSAETKQTRIAAIIEKLQGRQLDAHYLGYFECFNRQLYYEAHEVLEQIWLPQRAGPNGDFYKGLIQLAGAFVHLQKARVEPAKALFRLAEENLEKYPSVHQYLDLNAIISEIHLWRGKIESATAPAELLSANMPPKIDLVIV
jgi:predicted metal-dependent hydrolase